MKERGLIWLSFFALAWGGANVRAQELRVLEFRVVGMSCEACARTARSALEHIEGLRVRSIDVETGKTVVEAPRTVVAERIKEVLADRTQFEAFFAGETLPRPLSEAERAGLDLEALPPARKVRLEDHLAPGKRTIFYFHAEWCGPCRLYGPRLERLVQAYPERLALRKVDVVDWDTPVARQLGKRYRMPGLPFTLVFDERGKLVGQVTGNDVERLKQLLGLLSKSD